MSLIPESFEQGAMWLLALFFVVFGLLMIFTFAASGEWVTLFLLVGIFLISFLNLSDGLGVLWSTGNTDSKVTPDDWRKRGFEVTQYRQVDQISITSLRGAGGVFSITSGHISDAKDPGCSSFSSPRVPRKPGWWIKVQVWPGPGQSFGKGFRRELQRGFSSLETRAWAPLEEDLSRDKLDAMGYFCDELSQRLLFAESFAGWSWDTSSSEYLQVWFHTDGLVEPLELGPFVELCDQWLKAQQGLPEQRSARWLHHLLHSESVHTALFCLQLLFHGKRSKYADEAATWLKTTEDELFWAWGQIVGGVSLENVVEEVSPHTLLRLLESIALDGLSDFRPCWKAACLLLDHVHEGPGVEAFKKHVERGDIVEARALLLQLWEPLMASWSESQPGGGLSFAEEEEDGRLTLAQEEGTLSISDE